MKQTDARVRYTKWIIEKSFLSLLREKPCARITVTELCQRAEINRATFYKHYLDIPDLLEKLESELFDTIRSVFSESPIPYETFMLRLLNYLRENSEKVSLLSSEHGLPGFLSRAFALCAEYGYPLFTERLAAMDEPLRLLIYGYITQGTGGLLSTWIRSGMRQSPEELNALLLSLADSILTRRPPDSP